MNKILEQVKKWLNYQCALAYGSDGERCTYEMTGCKGCYWDTSRMLTQKELHNRLYNGVIR